MTNSELHTAFQIELDKLPIASCPSFLPEEIDYWLNKAYIMIINQKFTGNNPMKLGFEQSQKRVSDLSKLIKSVQITTMPCGVSPSTIAKANDFMYFVDGDLYHKNSSNGISVSSSIIPITHEAASRFKTTATNSPIIVNPVLVQEENNFKVYYDTTTTYPLTGSVMSMDYRYISMPTEISYSSGTNSPVIAEYVHNEIASLAAFLAIENIESSRVGTSAQIINIQE